MSELRAFPILITVSEAGFRGGGRRARPAELARSRREPGRTGRRTGRRAWWPLARGRGAGAHGDHRAVPFTPWWAGKLLRSGVCGEGGPR